MSCNDRMYVSAGSVLQEVYALSARVRTLETDLGELKEAALSFVIDVQSRLLCKDDNLVALPLGNLGRLLDLLNPARSASVGRNPEGQDGEARLGAEHEHAVRDSADAQPTPGDSNE